MTNLPIPVHRFEILDADVDMIRRSTASIILPIDRQHPEPAPRTRTYGALVVPDEPGVAAVSVELPRDGKEFVGSALYRMPHAVAVRFSAARLGATFTDSLHWLQRLSAAPIDRGLNMRSVPRR